MQFTDTLLLSLGDYYLRLLLEEDEDEATEETSAIKKSYVYLYVTDIDLHSILHILLIFLNYNWKQIKV